MTLNFEQLLQESGVTALDKWATVSVTAEALRRYVGSLNGSGLLDVGAAHVAAVREMKAHGVRDAHRLASAAFAERKALHEEAAITVTREPEP